jgi:hypothetical protein
MAMVVIVVVVVVVVDLERWALYILHCGEVSNFRSAFFRPEKRREGRKERKEGKKGKGR